MATNLETMWVSDEAQLQATVATLVGRGGVVQNQAEGEVFLHLKKRRITVRVGTPNAIRTDKQHWYDQEAVDGASPGTVPPAPAEPAKPSTVHLPPPPAQPAAGAAQPEPARDPLLDDPLLDPLRKDDLPPPPPAL